MTDATRRPLVLDDGVTRVKLHPPGQDSQSRLVQDMKYSMSVSLFVYVRTYIHRPPENTENFTFVLRRLCLAQVNTTNIVRNYKRPRKCVIYCCKYIRTNSSSFISTNFERCNPQMSRIFVHLL